MRRIKYSTKHNQIKVIKIGKSNLENEALGIFGDIGNLGDIASRRILAKKSEIA
jgi:hypothetical protein